MSVDDSVAAWVGGLKRGDPAAVQRVWERYFRRLVGLACRILESTARGPADEEDVALSAFKSFYCRAREGKFPQLDDPNDLWKLLVTITVRKAFKVRRKERRTVGILELPELERRLAGSEPDPQVAAAFADELRRLIGLLDDEAAGCIAAAKLQGYTNREIARSHNRSVAFVKRRLQLIRRIWAEEMP